MKKIILIFITLIFTIGIFLTISGFVDLTFHKSTSEAIYKELKQKGFPFDMEKLDRPITRDAIFEIVAGLYLFICSIIAYKFNKKSWYLLISIACLGFLYGGITLAISILRKQMMSPFYCITTIIFSTILFFITNSKKSKNLFGITCYRSN